MPRGKSLFEIERGQILAFHEEGVNSADIAREPNRSPNVILRFLKSPQAATPERGVEGRQSYFFMINVALNKRSQETAEAIPK